MRKIKVLGIYIHIPFCESKCNYCAFNSFVAKEEEKEKYLDVLIEDISFFAKNNKRRVDTIYIGGGTPSLLNVKQFERLAKAIMDNFVIEKNYEFTIEANPNSLTEEKLKSYINLGVNRLSIGVQSLNDNSLKFVGRRHNSAEALEKIKLAKKYIKNISCDLLIGLPTTSCAEYLSALNTLIAYGVTHISSYMLQVEDGTLLKEMVIKNPKLLPDDDSCADIYQKMVEFLKKKNFQRYEISNFALKGFESKHNIKYWTGEEYIGFGLSAHSYIGGVRWSCADRLSDFYAHKKGMEEIIGDKEKIEEHIMLGLRCFNGIDLSYLCKLNYNIKNNAFFKEYLQKGILIEKGENKVVLNPDYYSVNNLIITNLLP